LRLTIAALIGSLLLAVLLHGTVGFVRPTPVQAHVGQNMQSAIGLEGSELLQDRWLGEPAVWAPPPIAGTQIRFFTVTGNTQHQLIESLDGSGLCATYRCLPDPAAPAGGSAWALQGGGFEATACYSPRTAIRTIESFVVLPKWVPKPSGGVTVSLVTRWNALQAVLYVHEATHAAIAIQDFTALNNQARLLPSCLAWVRFWSQPSLFAQEEADQNAFHARLRADCRPAIGCFVEGWLGW